MFELFLFAVGIAVGSIVTQIILYRKTGRGKYTLEKLPEEEDLYTINIQLERDQALDKKTQILLKRSQK